MMRKTAVMSPSMARSTLFKELMMKKALVLALTKIRTSRGSFMITLST